MLVAEENTKKSSAATEPEKLPAKVLCPLNLKLEFTTAELVDWIDVTSVTFSTMNEVARERERARPRAHDRH